MIPSASATSGLSNTSTTSTPKCSPPRRSRTNSSCRRANIDGALSAATYKRNATTTRPGASSPPLTTAPHRPRSATSDQPRHAIARPHPVRRPRGQRQARNDSPSLNTNTSSLVAQHKRSLRRRAHSKQFVPKTIAPRIEAGHSTQPRRRIQPGPTQASRRSRRPRLPQGTRTHHNLDLPNPRRPTARAPNSSCRRANVDGALSAATYSRSATPTRSRVSSPPITVAPHRLRLTTSRATRSPDRSACG